MGVPAKIIRDSTERDLESIDHVVASYLELGRLHASGCFPNIADELPNARLG